MAKNHMKLLYSNAFNLNIDTVVDMDGIIESEESDSDFKGFSENDCRSKSAIAKSTIAKTATESDTKSYLMTLNIDCLINIFEYLEVIDLIQLCQVNSYFQIIIIDNVIRQKLLNLSEINRYWPTVKVFELFGKSMKKLKISEANISNDGVSLSIFDELLRLITQFCTVEKLTDIELEFKITQIDADLMSQAMPFLQSIQNVCLDATERQHMSAAQEEFLTQVITSFTKLRSLKLKRVRTAGNWLHSDRITNLQELSLDASAITDWDNFENFMQRNRNLRRFSWIGSRPNQKMCESVASYSPNIEHFADIQKYCFSVNLDDDFLMSRYNYLTNLNNLKKLTITSYYPSCCDLYDVIEAIATNNTIEQLTIRVVPNSLPTIDNGPFRIGVSEFARMKYLELQNYQHQHDKGGTDKLLRKLIPPTCNLKEFTVSSLHRIDDIVEEVVRLANNLTLLNINDSTLESMERTLSLLSDIIKKKQRKENIVDPAQKQLHLKLNNCKIRSGKSKKRNRSTFVPIYETNHFILPMNTDDDIDMSSFIRGLPNVWRH